MINAEILELFGSKVEFPEREKSVLIYNAIKAKKMNIRHKVYPFNKSWFWDPENEFINDIYFFIHNKELFKWQE